MSWLTWTFSASRSRGIFGRLGRDTRAERAMAGANTGRRLALRGLLCAAERETTPIMDPETAKIVGALGMVVLAVGGLFGVMRYLAQQRENVLARFAAFAQRHPGLKQWCALSCWARACRGFSPGSIPRSRAATTVAPMWWSPSACPPTRRRTAPCAGPYSWRTQRIADPSAEPAPATDDAGPTHRCAPKSPTPTPAVRNGPASEASPARPRQNGPRRALRRASLSTGMCLDADAHRESDANRAMHRWAFSWSGASRRACGKAPLPRSSATQTLRGHQ